MNFSCPRCIQSLEAEEEFIGQAISCPTCGQKFSIPNPPRARAHTAQIQVAKRPGAAAPAYRPPSSFSGYAPAPAPGGGGGFGKLLLVLLLLSAGAFGFACYQFDESPGQVWGRLVNWVSAHVSSPATPAPAPVATPTPTPTRVSVQAVQALEASKAPSSSSNTFFGEKATSAPR